MLELKTKKELSTDAQRLAESLHFVRYRSTTYIPADCETKDASVAPPPERTIWLPLSREALARIAATQFKTMFSSDGELSSFAFMVAQASESVDQAASSLLVRTADGLRELDESGRLVDVTGEFRPNAVLPLLNEDPADKQAVFDIVTEWLNSEEEAESLLTHLATSLAPGWSAVKYILLLGEGRNGKSVLMKMLLSLFGQPNVSSVTRQMMAEQSPTVTDLNGKLLNIVFDGPAEYLKDSGAEKSLIAGEPFQIRKLYESSSTTVQTTALFVEGLNHEPKSKDKSTALQKRLVRFQFPNVYALDLKFEKRMLSEKMTGALLALLIDRYVTEDEVATKLAPTTRSIELQLEQMYSNSLGLQFLKYLEEEQGGAEKILGEPMPSVIKQFQSWRITQNDLGTWAEPDVQSLFLPLANTERKSMRIENKPRKVRVLTSFKTEALNFIESLKGDGDDGDADAVLLDALVDE